jgi:serine protease Do
MACALFICAVSIAAAAAQSQPQRVVPQSAPQLRQSYAPIVKKAAPAVVNIYTRRVVRQRDSGFLFDDPFFRRFFGEEGPFAQLQPERQRIQNSLGSGVIVDASGLVVTNTHVIRGADEIRVVLSDRREFDAQLVASDDKADLSVLRIDKAAGPLPFIALANSDQLEVGDLVLAIGNPFGIGQTVTGGIVSALARTTVGVTDYRFFIQTDAAINPGNSGGALVDMDGRLVGINTAIFSRSGGSQGVGFAIPANMVATVVSAVATGAKLVRPWLGASGRPVTPEIAEALSLSRPVGVLLEHVHPDGPAAAAGIKVGDVITALDGLDVDDSDALRFRVATRPVGSSAELTLIRDGKPRNVRIAMLAPPEVPPRDLTEITGFSPLQGAVVANMSPALSAEMSMESDQAGVVVVEIKPNSRAQRLRLRPGDFVLAINDDQTPNVAQLRRAIARASGGWRITVRRGDRVITATITG